MKTKDVSELQKIAIQVRKKIVSMVYEAQSGHPGGSLSAADLMTVLYFSEMNIDPENPKWHERDRFVLSKGHACPAWYACLQTRGYFDEENLHHLRQLNSILQGHPDMKKTPGVDMTTGSLGIGAASAIGMALEAKMEGSPRRVYSIVGDGELNEGVIWETLQSAVKFKLDKYCMIIDKNGLQLDGPTTEVMPLPKLKNIIEDFGWKVIEIDGHNIPEIIKAIEEVKSTKEVPCCIIANTIKGKGVSFMENQLQWHGQAPNDEQYAIAIREIEGGLK